MSVNSAEDHPGTVAPVADKEESPPRATGKISGAGKLQMFADILWTIRRKAFTTQPQRGSIIQRDVLIAIAMSENMRVNYAELEALVGRPKRTLQYIIRDLEGIGVVGMEHSPEDRRRRIVYLTEAGKTAFGDYVDYIEEKLRILTQAGYCLPPTEPGQKRR